MQCPLMSSAESSSPSELNKDLRETVLHFSPWRAHTEDTLTPTVEGTRDRERYIIGQRNTVTQTMPEEQLEQSC